MKTVLILLATTFTTMLAQATPACDEGLKASALNAAEAAGQESCQILKDGIIRGINGSPAVFNVKVTCASEQLIYQEIARFEGPMCYIQSIKQILPVVPVDDGSDRSL